MRRRILIGAAPLLLAAFPAFAHPPRQPEPAEATHLIEEVKRFRDRLARAVKAKDRATLAALYADRFTHTDAQGRTEDRAARIAAAMAGQPMIEAAPATGLAFRVFAGPTVIATGRSLDVSWLAVYVTARDGWELAASQATRLAGTTD